MTPIRIRGTLGELYGELNVPDRPAPMPLVIFSHGFGGNLLGHADYAAHFLSRGLATFGFDFTGGGLDIRSGGRMTDMSVLTEAQDLFRVVDYFQGSPRFSRLFLFGASQGGFVSAWAACERPDDFDAVVLEYPAFVLQDDAWERRPESGIFPEEEIVLGRPIGRRYNEDAISFDIYARLGSLTADVLIVHGDADPIVPLAYTERAQRKLPHAEALIFEGQGHGFTGEARQEAMEEECRFLLMRRNGRIGFQP